MRFSRSQKISISKMVVRVVWSKKKMVFQIFNSTSLFVIVFLFDRHYLSVLPLIDQYIEYSMIEHWHSKQKLFV